MARQPNMVLVAAVEVAEAHQIMARTILAAAAAAAGLEARGGEPAPEVDRVGPPLVFTLIPPSICCE